MKWNIYKFLFFLLFLLNDYSFVEAAEPQQPKNSDENSFSQHIASSFSEGCVFIESYTVKTSDKTFQKKILKAWGFVPGSGLFCKHSIKSDTKDIDCAQSLALRSKSLWRYLYWSKHSFPDLLHVL